MDLHPPRLTAALVVACILTGCGYDSLRASNAQVNSDWHDVVSQYQRRADLVAKLAASVETGDACAQAALAPVVEARLRAASILPGRELTEDPRALMRFQQAQEDLAHALDHLSADLRPCPGWSSKRDFRDLQAQLDATAIRIAEVRDRYVQDVDAYDVLVRTFPTNLTAHAIGARPKARFTAAVEGVASPRSDARR